MSSALSPFESATGTSTDDKPVKIYDKPHFGPYKTCWKFLGFNKGYNFPLFIIFAGAMLGFGLARLQYLDVGGLFAEGAAPGEWYWYRTGFYRVGITLHLATCLPAALLIPWQFVPAIRHKLILFHRINGWTIVVLIFLTNAGILMIARRSFGGLPTTQTAIGLLVILVTVGLVMAVYNIKRLQIDQHRAWMLRTMFWLGTIITIRIIMIIFATIVPMTGNYYSTMSCSELATLVSAPSLKSQYPQCSAANGTVDGNIAIQYSMQKDSASVAVDLQQGFSIGMWLAIFMHTAGVEIYLNLTRNESERLRQVSYEKQLKAGMRTPGCAGLTADRWGDNPEWKGQVADSGV